eukprot:6178216-Pleurochrysis_carterae.AAC.2
MLYFRSTLPMYLSVESGIISASCRRLIDKSSLKTARKGRPFAKQGETKLSVQSAAIGCMQAVRCTVLLGYLVVIPFWTTVVYFERICVRFPLDCCAHTWLARQPYLWSSVCAISLIAYQSSKAILQAQHFAEHPLLVCS